MVRGELRCSVFLGSKCEVVWDFMCNSSISSNIVNMIFIRFVRLLLVILLVEMVKIIVVNSISWVIGNVELIVLLDFFFGRMCQVKIV